MPEPDLQIGVDLGGTKTEVVALDAAGAERWRERVPTPGDYDGALAAIRDLVLAAERALGATGSVGVGHPGTERPGDDAIKNANSTWLNGRPLRRDLERALDRPVALANDADCFALSEARDGAGRGAEVVFGAILGTGVGGGIVVRGELLRGPNRIAGEWGHNPFPSPTAEELPAPPCYCGRAGCVETYLCGAGLLLDHRRRGAPEDDPPTDAAEVARRAAAGDARATASIERYADRLARALGVVIDILDPDVVVLGGGLSNVDALYALVPPLLAAHVFSDEVRTRLERNVHRDSSGVRGAAWLGAGR